MTFKHDNRTCLAFLSPGRNFFTNLSISHNVSSISEHSSPYQFKYMVILMYKKSHLNGDSQ